MGKTKIVGIGGQNLFLSGTMEDTGTVLLMGITNLHYFFAVDCTDIQGC